MNRIDLALICVFLGFLVVASYEGIMGFSDWQHHHRCEYILDGDKTE